MSLQWDIRRDEACRRDDVGLRLFHSLKRFIMRFNIIVPVAWVFSLTFGLVGCEESGHADGQGGSGGGGQVGSGGGEIGGDLPACSAGPVQADSDVFDPTQVYLVGTRVEGACGMDAVAHWSSPNVHVGAFDCYFDDFSAKVRPSDGRLLYTIGFEGLLHEFRCDDCAASGGTPEEDPVIPTTPCSPEDNGILDFLVSPAGATVHKCWSDAFTWYDASGKVIYIDKPGEELVHVGHGDLALTTSTIVRLSTGKATPIIGLPSHSFLTVRAREPGSFLVAIGATNPELWEVGANGIARKRGEYPALPAGAQSVGYSSRLEACGALLQFANGPMVFQDIIVRRELGGASAVVYDEATNPEVKIHISSLMTGP